MALTFTASEFTSGVKEGHYGVMSKSCVLDYTGTISSRSHLLFVKIPHSAVILDYIWYAVDQGTDQRYGLGVRYPLGDGTYLSEDEDVLEAVTMAGVTIMPRSVKLPVKISITSVSTERWAWLYTENFGATSGSCLHRFTVFYAMDGS